MLPVLRTHRSEAAAGAVRARLSAIAVRGWVPGADLGMKGVHEVPDVPAEEQLPDRISDAGDRAGPRGHWSGTMATTAARLWRELPADAAPDSARVDAGADVDAGAAADAGAVADAGSRPVAGSGDFAGWSGAGSAGRHSRAEVRGLLRCVRGVAARFQELRLDPGRRPAMAAIVVALIAVLVTIWLVWRARPTPEAVGAVPAAAVPDAAVPTGAMPTAASVLGDPGSAAAATPAAPVAAGMVVAVTGKVRRPGLVHLPTGARVADAIDAAGGLRPGADIGLLNLARVLTDGEQVLVGIGATGAVPGGSASGVGDSGAGGTAVGSAGPPISLNAASAAQLDTLPGVGEVTAQKIIDYRTAHGPFRSIEALQDIPGIGPARYAEIAPEVTL